jgi:hypothetical protein
VLHDVRHRDVAGAMRQLDVGVIDDGSGERRVHALVEVQRRRSKVDVKDLGNWIYKRDTLGAKELVAVSERGFTASVLKHARKIHKDTVRLGVLHEVQTGLIERFNSTCLGITRVFDLSWFAAIFVQFADADQIVPINVQGLNVEEKIFETASPMDIVRFHEGQTGAPAPGIMYSLIGEIGGLSYNGRSLKRVILVYEKQRRIWDPATTFYTYDEVHPTQGQKGIAIVSTFRVDESRTGKLTLVVSPDAEALSGNQVRIAGQFEFSIKPF